MLPILYYRIRVNISHIVCLQCEWVSKEYAGDPGEWPGRCGLPHARETNAIAVGSCQGRLGVV